MSTRSRTRIHKSFQEDVLNEAADVGSKIDRKTRNRRLKENCDALNVTRTASQKRKNYVTNPLLLKQKHDAGDAGPSEDKKNNTLKELNVEVSVAKNPLDHENNVATLVNKPAARQTRRTKRFVENNEEENAPADGVDITAADVNRFASKIGKINKKKKSQQDEVVVDINVKENEEVRQVPQKKSKRKKKGKKLSGAMIVEDVNVPFGDEKKSSVRSANTSVDSFHSAAGSPDNKDNYVNINGNVQDPYHTLDKLPVDKNITISNEDEPKSSHEKLAETHSPSPSTSKSPNSSVVTSSRKRKRSSMADNKDSTFNKSTELEVMANVSKKLDSTFDKDDNSNNSSSKPLNTTSERDSRARKSLRVSKATEEISSGNSKSLNGTFDIFDTSKIHSTSKTLDTTFDKSNSNKTPDSEKHDLTFEKPENCPATIKVPAKKSSSITSDQSAKSSIISSDASDGTVNVTFDKSDENLSTISITSDESKTENLLNATPVLIESSMETSDLSGTSPLPKPTGEPTDVSITPLKRESTFTKDGPDPIIIMSPLPRTPSDDSVKTPTKRTMSLPSPGRTPYNSNTKPSKKKSILNVTRSIEKPTLGRISLLEPVRTTKVMFCSPVDNPALNTQRKSKVIKSSMKGSNKSFLFEEKGRGPIPRSAPRKRSYTASDADEVRAKRTRLADELQLSVNRLSRPRTSSAAGTPVPQPATPARSRSESKRLKLPNFAALHQRQFSRMESLDECQQRRARRARQLLVPTGGLQVLERASPKLTPAEPPKSATKETETEKQQTASKTKPQAASKAKVQAPEVPKPGYTRFGFKLNLDVNPFSVPSKTSTQKPTESEPNDIPKRTVAKPSVAGVTGVRKEVAKQLIMREKSATSLREKRDAKRDESRTIIKGVRTNRRFELQMRSRNING